MQSIADPSNLTALWARTRAMFARAAAALGGAAAIAAITVLSRAARRDVVRWLAPLEHIVRKLLFAEAIELHRAGLAQAARMPRFQHVALQDRSVGAARTNPRTPRAPELSQPETWSARFSLSIPRDPRAVPENRAPRIRALWGPTLSPPPQPPPRAPRRQQDPAFRLARRFEALRCALENPLLHARRLAHLLLRIKHRFSEVVHRYLFALARSDAFDPHDPRLPIEAWSAAMDREDAFRDSS